MVGGTGIEPVTPCVSSKCSTAELTAHVAVPVINNDKGLAFQVICVVLKSRLIWLTKSLRWKGFDSMLAFSSSGL